MKNWKKILCPVDFSPVSKAALQYAAGLCRESKAYLLIIHVLEPIADPGNYVFRPVTLTDLKEQRLQYAHNSLEEAVRSLKLARDAYSASVEHGLPSEEIVRVADQENVDLIVIGTQGLTGLSHVLLGSTAERVVRKANCPVLTLKRPAGN
ncbi:MAG: universal stress protein [Acidobacteriota bacterium]|jgi:nucleotide-binding universal stress UspA family protein